MKYPIYIPSRGRYEETLTIDLLHEAELSPWVVVEPREVDAYATALGSDDRILALDNNNRGIAYARNWIKEHAIASGVERHWQIDDNIRNTRFYWKRKRLWVDPKQALGDTEMFVDRYTNVAIAGLMNTAFGHTISGPFSTNKMVYCCMLIRSDEYRWDENLNGIEDVDYSLQVLVGGQCTILMRGYQVEKMRSGFAPGGNTDIYENDGRLRRARALQRKWPNLVEISRMWGRPRHDLQKVWRKFDHPLIHKETP